MTKPAKRRRLGVEVAVPARHELGEGAVWDDRRQRFLWVDLLDGVVYSLAPVSARRELELALPVPVGAVLPRRQDGYALALADAFAVAGDAGELRTIAPVEAADDGTRLNDAACDPLGRIWGGTMAYDEAPGRGALYRLDLDGSLTKVLPQVSVSNGIGWSPSGDTMYYVDSPTGRVDRFRFDRASGEIREREPLATIRPAGVEPDGLSVDAQGGIWVALWGAGAVHRYTPGGELDTIVELPATQVTNCAFGGSGLETLYITTASQGLDRRAEPEAGYVFACQPGVAGMPCHRCAL